MSDQFRDDEEVPKVNLMDPDVEPTEEQWDSLLRSVGRDIKKEGEKLKAQGWTPRNGEPALD